MGRKALQIVFSRLHLPSGSDDGCSRPRGWWRWSSSSSCVVSKGTSFTIVADAAGFKPARILLAPARLPPSAHYRCHYRYHYRSSYRPHYRSHYTGHRRGADGALRRDTDGTRTGRRRGTDGTPTGHRRRADGAPTGHRRDPVSVAVWVQAAGLGEDAF